MYKNRFCYRIAKEAEIGWDNELNEPCEVYTQMSIDTEKEVPQDLKDSMHLKLKDGMASQIGIDAGYLTPITVEEYDANVDED
jgi:hypothetical protein